MNMTTAASVALGALLLAATVLGTLIVIGRAARNAKDRRRKRTAAPSRRMLLSIAAGDDEADYVEALVALPPQTWRAVEPSAVAMLGKVRGDAHTALVAVFERRGAATHALHNLRHRDPVTRARSAEVLGNLARQEAVPELCRLLADRDSDVRVVAARALGRIGDPAAAKWLLASVAGRRPVPLPHIAQAVARLGNAAQKIVVEALDHPAEGVRAAAVEALGLSGAVSAATQIGRTIRDDPSIDVRIRAARTLGRLGIPSALPPLLAALEPYGPAALRAVSARALGELGAVAATDALAVLLGDPQYRVAHNAARALLRLGKEGHAALQAATQEGPAPRHAAKEEYATDRIFAAAHAREALAVAALDDARRRLLPALAGARRIGGTGRGRP